MALPTSHGLISTQGIIRDGVDSGTAAEPGNGTAVNLVAPLSGDYGVTAPIFASTGMGISGAGLEFQNVGDSNFTSFIIPDALPNGATSYTIQFGNTTAHVDTGTTFDFTPFAAGGVGSFLINNDLPVGNLALRSFAFAAVQDASSSDFDSPFVWGATYSQDGTALVNITSVPEPATIILFGLGAIGLFAVARRRK